MSGIEEQFVCPICAAGHRRAVEHCRRCGCRLLLLLACRIAAERLHAQGEVDGAQALAGQTTEAAAG